MTLDPAITNQLSSFAIAAAMLIGGWIYHKVKGDGAKQASITDLLKGIARNALHDAAVTAESKAADLTAIVEAAVWKGLPASVPRNDTTTLLVHVAVQTLVADAIQAAKDVQSGIDENVATAKAEMAKPVPLAPVIPNIGDRIETTIVPRDGTEEFKPVGQL